MHIDLHLHSNASDGALAPAAVVAAARAGGLDVIALADHDTVAGIAEARAAAVGCLQVIPAIELSSTLDGRELHILGYCIDPAEPALVSYTNRAHARRAERMHGILALLANRGLPSSTRRSSRPRATMRRTWDGRISPGRCSSGAT